MSTGKIKKSVTAKPKPLKSSVTAKGVYPYPSFYGSHLSMVDEAETKKLADPERVVCRDEFGDYITERSRLDNRLADPARSRPHD